MHPKSAMWLDDIAEKCAFIGKETTGRSFTDYEQDHLVRSAIERNVEIIGHALMRLGQTDPATAARMSDYRKLIGLGDQPAHRSDETNNEQAWDMILHVLPVLRAEVEQLLPEADDDADAESMGNRKMHPLIEHHLDAIRALCREFSVTRLEVFGSAMTDRFDLERSDVDFIVEYPPDYEFGPWLSRYFELKERLEALLDRPVDPIMVGAMRNPYFIRSANRSRRLLYAA